MIPIPKPIVDDAQNSNNKKGKQRKPEVRQPVVAIPELLK